MGGSPPLSVYFLNEREFCKKIKENASLTHAISSSDFQTFSTVFIFFVLEMYTVPVLERYVDANRQKARENRSNLYFHNLFSTCIMS